MGVVSCGTTMLDQGVFENIGAVTWDTTVKTSGFTAVSGNGYFCNTTSAAFTVTLPSSPSAGDIVGIKDYANTADTNNITLGRNSSNIQGQAEDFKITTEGRSVLLVYVDGTKGWLVTSASQASSLTPPATFIAATGGTISTVCTNFKVHTFTGPGTFCVSSVGNAEGSSTVSYMVIAGGGSGGSDYGGGGGAGGFRESKAASDSYTASPLNATSGPGYNLPVSVQGYTITIGAGGAGRTADGQRGADGSASVFSSITSTGGGGGGTEGSPAPATRPGRTGGSGGGGSYGGSAGGAGNTPSVSPAQGTNGGIGGPGPALTGGGGGGATVVGTAACGTTSGAGGAGATSSINATPTARAGGGGGAGGGSPFGQGYTPGPGGAGGGGAGAPTSGGSGVDGTANTGGGGGAGNLVTTCSGAGGSGIVIIRYKFQ